MSRIASLERNDVAARGELVPEFLRPAPIDPAHDFSGGHAHRNGREEGEAGGDALPVIFRRMIHVGCARAGRVKAFQRADEFSGCVDFDFKQAFTHLVNGFSKPFGHDAQGREVLGPAGRHAELLDTRD